MQRNLLKLTQTEYDVLVIGGGIYGACTAWDAALRGLRVALIERSDFGNGTSANSLKTIHGGLRYLQDGNLLLVRKMIQERKNWLRIVPHLVQPLPFILPIDKRTITRTQPALYAAAALIDAIGFDRNRGLPPTQHLPASRVLSQADVRRMGFTQMDGALLWYDAQMYNSERVMLSLLQGAAQHGADLANYVEMVHLLHEGRQVRGVVARDVITGSQFEVQARLTINCTGQQVDTITNPISSGSSRFRPSVAVNLVTRQIRPDPAVGITGTHGQTLFVVPWRDYSLIGTLHLPVTAVPDINQIPLPVVQDFIAQVNRALPEACLTLDDIYRVHSGYLPTIDGGVQLLREGRVCDHTLAEGIEGLITVVGVKYTTARMIAEQTIDLAVRKLHYKSPTCATAHIPLSGADSTAAASKLVSPAVLAHLRQTYGAAYRDILQYLEAEPTLGTPVAPDTFVTAAEIIHAVRAEMALTLTDVILRRTELGTARLPDPATLHICAEIMARELGWDSVRQQYEIDTLVKKYPNLNYAYEV